MFIYSLCFVSEINEEKEVLFRNMKLAARHPSFSTKVTAFVIQDQEYWYGLGSPNMLVVCGPLLWEALWLCPSLLTLWYTWLEQTCRRRGGHRAVVVTVHGGDNVTISRVFSCF